MKTYEVTYPFDAGERAYPKGAFFTRPEVACWFPEDAAAVDQKIEDLIAEGRVVEAPETVVETVVNKTTVIEQPTSLKSKTTKPPTVDPVADSPSDTPIA